MTSSLLAAQTGSPPVPADTRIPGNRGMWAGILAEMTEFALLFLVYFVARGHAPEAFRAGPASLNLLAGTANTLLMVSSSYCVARALAAIRSDRRHACIGWLVMTVAGGMGYLVVKYFELAWNAERGIVGNAGIFFAVYYYLTFTHMVHVVWGLLGGFWVIVRAGLGVYSATDYEGVEAFGCYWHATDLAWLVIFPLLYVLK